MLLGLAAQRLDDLGERLRLRSPVELVRTQLERLALRHARLGELVTDHLRRCAAYSAGTIARLVPDLISSRLAQLRPRLAREQVALSHGIGVAIDRCRRALEGQASQVEALSHARVLERGYAIVRGRAGGQVIPRLAAVGVQSDLDIVFADGTLAVRRLDRGRARGAGEERQGSLL
jgi:exodeoxyribonuclease VII large subunit